MSEKLLEWFLDATKLKLFPPIFSTILGVKIAILEPEIFFFKVFNPLLCIHVNGFCKSTLQSVSGLVCAQGRGFEMTVYKKLKMGWTHWE